MGKKREKQTETRRYTFENVFEFERHGRSSFGKAVMVLCILFVLLFIFIALLTGAGWVLLLAFFAGYGVFLSKGSKTVESTATVQLEFSKDKIDVAYIGLDRHDGQGPKDVRFAIESKTLSDVSYQTKGKLLHIVRVEDGETGAVESGGREAARAKRKSAGKPGTRSATDERPTEEIWHLDCEAGPDILAEMQVWCAEHGKPVKF